MTELNYEDDLRINPDELDIAALEQSELSMQYGRELAYHERLVKKAHERVKTLRAQLVKNATDFPEDLLGKGIKPTAVNVESYYRLDPEYQEAKKTLHQAEYDRDLVKVAYDGIGFQRKKMIEVLTQLYQMEYFGGPSVPRDLAKEYRKKREQRQQTLEQEQTPRRRKV